MRFAKDKVYKLTEIAGALIISDSDQKVRDLTAQPLIVADAWHLFAYLDRYLFEREQGKSLRDAHEAAMKTAGITRTIPKPP